MKMVSKLKQIIAKPFQQAQDKKKELPIEQQLLIGRSKLRVLQYESHTPLERTNDPRQAIFVDTHNACDQALNEQMQQSGLPQELWVDIRENFWREIVEDSEILERNELGGLKYLQETLTQQGLSGQTVAQRLSGWRVFVAELVRNGYPSKDLINLV